MSKSLLKTRALRWGVAALTLVTLALAMFLALAWPGRATALPAEPTGAPSATIHAIPGSDGTSLYVAAGRLGQLTVDVYAHVSGTSYERSHTMAYSPTSGEYSHTFEGILNARQVDSGTITITSTTFPVMGTSPYIRHYVPGASFEVIHSKDEKVSLHINTGSLPTDTYVLIMSTNVPPGDPPSGHRLIGQPYSIRASGALTQSLTPMLLQMDYDPGWLGDVDPHTLSVFYWHEDENPALRQWQNLESEPFGDEPSHVISVQRFGTYALMTSTTWRDTFQDYSGVDEREGVRLAYGGRLALRDGPSEGFAVSVPITPPGQFAGWGQLRYTAEITTGTALTVDVLAADGTPLLADLADGASLAAIDAAAHPSLRLRATLSRTQMGVTPYLDDWAINWLPETPPPPGPRLYLPLLTAGAGETGGQGDRERGRQGEGGRATGSLARVLPVSLSPHHSVSWFGCDPPPEPPIVWSPPAALTPGNGIAIAPDLAVDSNNWLHAVWYDGSRTVLYASKEPEVTTWTAPVAISSSGAAYYPDVAVDPQGNVHVIWEDNDDIFYASKPRGGGWSSPLNLSNTGQANIMPGLYADADGHLHAVWSDGSPGNDEILYAFKRSGASAWSPPERVSSTSGRSWAPAVVADRRGNVHVVWHDFTPGPTEIYYAMKSTGGAWTGHGNVSFTIGGSVFPALAVDSDDTVHVVWQDSIVTSSPPPPFKILYAHKPAGGVWSSLLQLSGDSGNAEMPTLAVGPENGLHVAWDTTDTLALLYVHRPQPEMGWTAPMTVTTISPGTQYPFPVLAASLTEAVHLLWSDLGCSNIFHSVAAPPPIPQEHVLVLDEEGFAVSGACIYQNGQLAGTTNDLGIFVLDSSSVGDQLVALKPLAEQAAAPGGTWAYRTALTSLEMDAAGAVSGYTVTVPGQQPLLLHSDLPLVYFNLLISIKWNATPEYMQEVADAVRQASNYLYDVSDGQMVFGHVAIYDDGMQWGNADIQMLAHNDVRPYAYVGGIVSDDPSHVICVGRHWDGDSGAKGSWSERNGFRTLIHEFGHYALHLYDSYFEYLYDGHGHLIGINKVTGCTEYYKDYDEATDATNATIMNYQYRASELAARDVPGLWRAENCQRTVQWQLTYDDELERGESDWETLLRHYADSAEPPRWRFSSPFERRSVLAGPDELPPGLLPFPEIEIHEVGEPAPPRQLTVLGSDGRPYDKSALVSLDTYQNGRLVTLDQGQTAVHPITRTGQITIYGASTGNTLRVVSIDGGLSAQTTVVTDTIAYTLTLRSSGRLRAAGAPVNPYASLIPSSDGRTLYLTLRGVEPGGALSALLVPPDSTIPQSTPLAYSASSGAYTGTVSFAALALGIGSLHARGLGSLGEMVAVDSNYSLLAVDATEESELYSPDGNLWLHLGQGSAGSGTVYAVLMSSGAVPQPLPPGRRVVGNAYAIQFSGARPRLERPGVLKLFYHPDLVGNPVGLGVYRWDVGTATWEPLGGELDEGQRSVSVSFERFGIYALLAAEGPVEQVFLPMMVR